MNKQTQAISNTSNLGSIMMYMFSALAIANIAYFLYSVAIWNIRHEFVNSALPLKIFLST